MFEVIVTLCLSLSAGPCRDHLLAGFEADTHAACRETLTRTRPALPQNGLVADGDPRCAPSGTALAVAEVVPGVFVHVGQIAEPNEANLGDVSNLGFIVGEKSVAVVDSGTARWMGEALWRSIRHVTDKPVSHMILTHMHPDHALGASVFAEAGAVVVGHPALPRALADRQANYLESLNRLIGAQAFLGTTVSAIDRLVDDAMEIDLGGRVLHLQAWQTAHTGTDITVLDSGSGTLFAGDLVFDQHTPALDGSLVGWRTVIAELQQVEISGLVPGHGGPLLKWPQESVHMDRYLRVLEQDTRHALEAGHRLGEAVEVIGQSEEQNWRLFEAYNARNATVAFTELEWE